MRIPLAVNSYQARSKPLSAQRLVNLYPETSPPDAKSRVVLIGTPGLALFATVGTGPVRGLQRMNNVLYAVSGIEVYKIAADGTATKLGDVTGSGPVSMADNGSQLVIVGDGKGWVCDGVTVVRITDPDFPPPSSVAWVDGYHVFTRVDTGQFFISSLYAATTYDALDYATAESLPDNAVAVFVDHREVWVFGEHSVEVWFNSGNATFPFERVTGASLERGCGGRYTIAKVDNSVFWLGEDNIVYRADGYTPVRISTHAIEYAIAKAGGQPRGWTYTQEGHAFYVLSYADATFVFDATVGLWHERQSHNLARWRVDCGQVCYGQNLVGDHETGQVYALDLDTYSENGAVMVRVATSPPIHADGKKFTMAFFEIEIESGAGLASGQGADPQVMLEWSDDGGATWSNEHWTSMGQRGDFSHRPIWRRLGQAVSRIMRVTIAEPIKVAIIAANTDVKVRR